MSPFEAIAKLKDRYPEDIEQIEAEGARLAALPRRQQYSLLPESQALIALCRNEITFARKRLATERQLTSEERDALWHIIDARQWFLAMVAKDYDAELEQVVRQLEAELGE